MPRILVAEDEPSVQAFVVRALSAAGHEVQAVADGGQAAHMVMQAGSEGRPYDLVLTDIVMPVMDGIALALQVARDEPETKILLMTGFADQRERAHRLEAIVQDILLKPFTLEDLQTAVSRALDA